MTPEQKYEIATLASEVHQKRMQMEMFTMCNVDTLETNCVEYEIAKMEWLEALAKLNRTQSEILNPR